MPRPSRLLAAVVLMVGLLLPSSAVAATGPEVAPAPTPTAAVESASPSASPGARPSGAQYRPDQGNDWSGSLIILGFFVLAMGGLVYIVRKGLASTADED